jgi:drug/metabolite transporter (DMT)-like permease
MRPAGAASARHVERRAAAKSVIALALPATWIAFGSSPAGTRFALETLSPILIMSARGIISGALLLAWGLWSGSAWPPVRQWLSSLLIGGLMLAGGAALSTWGQRSLASGIVGVLSALMPIFAAILGYILFRDRPTRWALVGLVVGLAGIGLLVRPGSQLDPFGVGLVVVAQGSWALGAVLAPRLDLPKEPRLAAATELLGGSAVLVVVGLALGEYTIDPASVALPSWLGLTWLVFTAVVGFAAYGLLVRTVPTPVATTFSYTNPIVALGLGMLLFGEPLSGRTLTATAVVVVGVCLIVSAESKAAPPDNSSEPSKGR